MWGFGRGIQYILGEKIPEEIPEKIPEKIMVYSFSAVAPLPARL